MSERILDQPLGSITVGDLKELMQEWVAKAIEKHLRDYYLDEEGYLVFANEAAYANYIARRQDTLPSEVRAYYIDEQGYKAYYSDWVPTIEYSRELIEIEQEIAAGKVYDFDQVVAELGLGRA